MTEALTMASVESQPLARPEAPPSAVEGEVIQMFVDLANSFGLPKSVGKLYGYIFLQDQPVCFDDLVSALGLSKGSVSQGLRVLTNLNAVKRTFVREDRRDHYVPEMSLKRLFGGLLQERFHGQFSQAGDRLEALEEECRQSGHERRAVLERIQILRRWQGRLRLLTPLVLKFLGRGGPRG